MNKNRISNNDISEPRLDRIRKRLEVLRCFAHAAQKRILFVNTVVAEALEVGLLPQTALLGSIVETRPYAPTPGGSDSGRVYQAALLVPGGCGLVRWDSEELSELKDVPEALEAQSFDHFIPFDDLDQAQQALLGCEVDRLIDMLVQNCE